MQFQGERTVLLPADALFARLSDASFLVTCIPDATLSESASADVASCSVRPNFTFARGSLDVTITVTSREPMSRVAFLLTSKGIGSSADVEAALVLDPGPTTTTIVWTASIVKLGGLLKAVPAGLIRGAAQKVIDDVWTSIEANLPSTS